MVTGNPQGFIVVADGVIHTYGDNYIDGNGFNFGSLTPVAKQ
ncbi:MAG: hypothetical protein QOI12_2190 [Alphaproteobacteria bacterium]|jgi:hypothetical protein|nr:hypothetical protein [Alphaproteobacteria bacterium]